MFPRPSALSIVAALATAAGTFLGLRGVMTPEAGAVTLVGAIVAGAALWRSTRALSVATRVIGELARAAGMQPLSTRPARWFSRRRAEPQRSETA
jgi:hypothetical protein